MAGTNGLTIKIAYNEEGTIEAVYEYANASHMLAEIEDGEKAIRMLKDMGTGFHVVQIATLCDTWDTADCYLTADDFLIDEAKANTGNALPIEREAHDPDDYWDGLYESLYQESRW